MNPEKLLRIICDNNLPKRLCIRVDAGPVKGLSFGHLSRCMVLAKALKKHHTKIRFIMRNYPKGVEVALKNGMDVQTIPLELSQAEQDALWLQKNREFDPDWTFMDLPDPEPFSEICFYLNQHGSKILFIHDTRFISPKVDTFLNSSILALKKNSVNHSAAKYLLGPDYFILDPLDPAKSISRPLDEKMNILLSFGGSDPSGLGIKVTNALKPHPAKKKFHLSIILGPGFRQKQKAAFLEHEKFIKLIDNPTHIYPCFLSSDLVICAGGRTLYELSALKIPAFPIASIEHERPVVNAFIQEKIVKTGMMEWNVKEFLIKFNRLLEEMSFMDPMVVRKENLSVKILADKTPVHAWSGKFGRDYTDRNSHTWNDLDQIHMELYGMTRSSLNTPFLENIPRDISILEIGTNIGTQLGMLSRMGFTSLHGIEVQAYALEKARQNLPGADLRQASASAIPFPDNAFDLVFTSGVLIHIAPMELDRVVLEMIRCSRRWIWGFEYFSEHPAEIQYHGRSGLMWKRDFCQLFLDARPGARAVLRQKVPYVSDQNMDEMYLIDLRAKKTTSLP